MIQDIEKNWRRIAKSLTPHRKLLLLMDFDGTLSRIAAKPSRARLSAGIKSALRSLARSPRIVLALLSGRSESFLRRHFQVKSVYYGGNHGLELRGPRLFFRHPSLRGKVPFIQNLSNGSRLKLKKIPGAIVENKKLSLSLHYRGVPPPHLGDFNRAIENLKDKTARWPLAWRAGIKAWEVLPQVPWNKGKAALWLYRNLGRPFPIAVGDDATDEDMFRALRGRGLTVRVGRNGRSRARYYLKNQSEVLPFLKNILNLVQPSVS